MSREPFPAAPERRAIHHAEVRIRVITHGLFINFSHSQAATQTISWLERHGIPYSDLCLMESKADGGAHIYVEDSPKTIEKLLAAEKGHHLHELYQPSCTWLAGGLVGAS